MRGKPFYVLGTSGAPHRIDGGSSQLEPHQFHDAAAVLLCDGEVVAAIEEERLDRIKHSNQFPLQAISYCLDAVGIAITDVDLIAHAGDESNLDFRLQTSIRRHLSKVLSKHFAPIESKRLRFLPHHMAHAASAYLPSGFDKSLTVILDGGGDNLSGLICRTHGVDIKPLRAIPPDKSLGEFYIAVIKHLGYDLFDEYKVMGLAPYGRAAVFNAKFDRCYTLKPRGEYAIDWKKVAALSELVPVRKKSAPLLQSHRDMAASLQRSLERIVLHVLAHFRQATGLRQLCLAGGVAHNSTMNGRILQSGLFDEVFVQPAAHDAGNALGAALYHYHLAKAATPKAMNHVYWGTDVREPAIKRCLKSWKDFVTFERMPDVVQSTSRLLARGRILGWVQGRSEFGPRALGNRSIVADPRPRENREIINRMVKLREGYRPLAPAVLEQAADDYFVMPQAASRLRFMNFVLPVHKRHHRLLGAVTHVDGSARVQTVDQITNPRFWNLIHAFGEITGVPMLLNTSFNNRHEPIVDSADDAVVCLLTTKLHGVVIGDYIVRRKKVSAKQRLALRPSPSPFIRIDESSVAIPNRLRVPVSPATSALLRRADGRKKLQKLLADAKVKGNSRKVVLREIDDLWSRRLLAMKP